MAGPHNSTSVLKTEPGRYSLEYSVYIISPVWVGRLILHIILEEPISYLEAQVMKSTIFLICIWLTLALFVWRFNDPVNSRLVISDHLSEERYMYEGRIVKTLFLCKDCRPLSLPAYTGGQHPPCASTTQSLYNAMFRGP